MCVCVCVSALITRTLRGTEARSLSGMKELLFGSKVASLMWEVEQQLLACRTPGTSAGYMLSTRGISKQLAEQMGRFRHPCKSKVMNIHQNSAALNPVYPLSDMPSFS